MAHKTRIYVLLAVCLLGTSVLAEDRGSSNPNDDVEDAPTRESGNSIETQVDKIGLPIYTTLNGSVTNLNEILPSIYLNRTKAFLNCSQGSMQVELMFQEPFYGLAYADFDRNSACMTKGRGLSSARIELPLKGCGTKQNPARVFTNNIVVRFHPDFEIDGDEVITIVCRYPPARAEVPGPLPNKIISPLPAAPVLSSFHIMLMICTLLFLALLLLGLGCSYMCLKRRPVPIIHRQAFTGSEITKISGSSALSRLTMFDDIKIPRIISTQQAYSSEHLVMEHSDTLPSDYPSESHSEVDEERSLPVSSAGSYETKAFVHPQVEQRASSSLYSETINEIESTAVTASRITQSRYAMPLEPKFDAQLRIKQRAPPPPSPLPSESEASIALERNLTTILEREETSRRIETSPPPRMTSFAYVPELHAPPSTSRQQTPPVYSRILRKQAERETVTETFSAAGPPLHRPRSLTSLNTEMTETRSLTEVTDASHAKYRVASMLAPTSPPPPPIAPSTISHVTEEYREMTREEVEPLVEPVVASRRPEITTHEVDDVFLRTVTEKKTIEDIERHTRQVTEYHARQQAVPDTKWDVTIRNYPTQEIPPPPPEWENFSDISSASNLTFTREHAMPKTTDEPFDSHIHPTYTVRTDIPARGSPHGIDETERSVGSYYNLERVLEEQYATEFTEEERKKWREIITTESTLRTLLTEAIVKEDYELIRKDSRYTTLFPATKWDVIIRIISPPSAPGSTTSSSHGKSGQRYKRGKATEWDNRSRRSSLPTLYEYESDGGSLAHDQLRHATGPGVPGTRIRKLSSTTRGGSEADLRSMSEMTVRDFVRIDRGDDQTSLSSFEGDSLVRSLSQPSLARSGSEFTEHWGVPARNLPHWGIDDEPSSTETTPRPLRRVPGGEVVSSSAFEEHTRQQSAPAPGVSTSFARSARYSEREIRMPGGSSAQGQQRPSSWFHDDSEPEMQI